MNKSKSDIYFNGMQNDVIGEILQVSGFSKGSLPFKYLGINISHKKLSGAECSILTERIIKKIRCWSVRKISYAGRVVLVQAVLSQLHSYWTRIFVLPSMVIKKIDSICRNFLWEGSEHYSKAPLVNWDAICLPKKCGGLGVRTSKLWNIALIGKYTWWIALKADHLWIKWVNHVYLKGLDWKHYTPAANTSWTWRKICSVMTRMKDGYVSNDWQSSGGKYTAAQGYKWLLGDQIPVPWAGFIWNRVAIPRYQFIGWLVMKRRILTLDRLHYMNLGSMSCFLCGITNETCDHLFFECCYSRRCIQELKNKLGIQFPELHWLAWCCRVRLKPLLRRKYIQAAILGLIYYIWNARNRARLDFVVLRPEMLVHSVLKELDVHFNYQHPGCRSLVLRM